MLEAGHSPTPGPRTDAARPHREWSCDARLFGSVANRGRLLTAISAPLFLAAALLTGFPSAKADNAPSATEAPRVESVKPGSTGAHPGKTAPAPGRGRSEAPPSRSERKVPSAGEPPAVVAAASSPVKISVSPAPPLIERKSASQQLNFDFIIENRSDAQVRITRIDLDVLDGRGKIAMSRMLDERGFDSGLNTIPDRTIGKKGTALLYNPFYEFDAAMPLARLRYAFTLITASKSRIEAVVEVSPIEYRTKTRLTLPLHKRFLVRDGHDFYSNHRRLDYLHPAARALGVTSNFMRYACDLCVISNQGLIVEGDEERNESWLGFGQPVYATAAGKVVDASDGMPDDRDFKESDVKSHPIRLFGNYLVIDHGNGEFSLYGHLQKGSLKVHEGERVRQGQVLAKVGASGSARMPHLHYELRTGADLNVEGLPATFTSYRRILGGQSVPVASGRIDTGDIVETVTPSSPSGKKSVPPPAAAKPQAGRKDAEDDGKRLPLPSAKPPLDRKTPDGP